MSNIDYIKSYMIRLGVDVDNVSFSKWDNNLKRLESSFQKTTSNLEKSDNKAKGIMQGKLALIGKTYAKLTGVLLSASAGIGKFMQSVANSDMEMQKFARSMYISTDQAKALQNTLGAMDMSIGDLQDIAYNPELLEQYKEFLSMAKSFKAPEGMKQSFKDIRSIFAEFQKFNLTFTYFRERVVHFIYNTVKTPAEKFKSFIQAFNTKFAVNINKFAEKLGTILGTILRLGLRIGEIFKNTGEFILQLWNRLSDLNKKLIGAFVVLRTIIKASPIWRLISLFTIITSLYDDYQTFNEGGISSEKLKPVWKFINDQRDNPDSVLNKILNAINTLIELVNRITEGLAAIWDDFRNSSIGKSLFGTKEVDSTPVESQEGGFRDTKFGQFLEKYNLVKFKDRPNRLVTSAQSVSSSRSGLSMQTPIPSPEDSITQTPINQTFNFNLDGTSLKDPQTFFNDVSTLIRNNQSSLVGGY